MAIVTRRNGGVERRVAIFRQALGFQIAELSGAPPRRADRVKPSGRALSFVVGLGLGVVLGIALAVLR